MTDPKPDSLAIAGHEVPGHPGEYLVTATDLARLASDARLAGMAQQARAQVAINAAIIDILRDLVARLDVDGSLGARVEAIVTATVRALQPEDGVQRVAITSLPPMAAEVIRDPQGRIAGIEID